MDRARSQESVRQSLQQLLRLSASRRGHARRMATVGVHLSQPAVAVLAQVCEAGPLPMGDLARATRIDAGATARQVAALEADGLVVRQRAEHDGRVNLVQATPAGHEVAERVAGAQTSELVRALQHLSDAELAGCAEQLARLTSALRAEERSADDPGPDDD